MNRRQMLGLLGLATPLLFASCKHDFPTTPTIVTGKVVDENDNPVEGITLRLSGFRKKGLSSIATFSITSDTDKAGVYEISEIVPDNTDEVSIIMEEELLLDSTGNIPYLIYRELDGIYSTVAGSRNRIPNSNYGKTTILYYQLRKK